MKKMLALLLAALLALTALPVYAADLSSVNIDGLNMWVPSDWSEEKNGDIIYYNSPGGHGNDFMMVVFYDTGIDTSLLTYQQWEDELVASFISGLKDSLKVSEKNLRQENLKGQMVDMITGTMTGTTAKGEVTFDAWILLVNQGSKVVSIGVFALPENRGDIETVAYLNALSMYFDGNIAGAPAEAPTPTPAPAMVDGMRKDFKEAMDSYDAFFDEYLEFMAEYEKNPTSMSLLLKLSEMLTQYAETMEKMEAWDDGTMNKTEQAYYLKIMNKVAGKMFGALGALG